MKIIFFNIVLINVLFISCTNELDKIKLDRFPCGYYKQSIDTISYLDKKQNIQFQLNYNIISDTNEPFFGTTNLDSINFQNFYNRIKLNLQDHLEISRDNIYFLIFYIDKNLNTLDNKRKVFEYKDIRGISIYFKSIGDVGVHKLFIVDSSSGTYNELRGMTCKVMQSIPITFLAQTGKQIIFKRQNNFSIFIYSISRNYKACQNLKNKYDHFAYTYYKYAKKLGYFRN